MRNLNELSVEEFTDALEVGLLGLMLTIEEPIDENSPFSHVINNHKFIGKDGKELIVHVLTIFNGRNVTKFLIDPMQIAIVLPKIINEEYDFLSVKTEEQVLIDNGVVGIFTLLKNANTTHELIEESENKTGELSNDKDEETYSFIHEKLAIDINTLVSKAIVLSEELKDLVKVKDHDLYLAFKANDDFSQINISLEKISPKLPEGGELSLGDTTLNPEDWLQHGKRAYVVAKRIKTCMKLINRHINNTGNRLTSSDLPTHYLDRFDKDLVILLMAASHYLTEVYIFKAEDGDEFLNEAANEILKRLNDHGGSIGLDLNSWVTWDYSDPTNPPVRVDELCLADELHSRYTESFVQCLYNKLFNTQSEYFKPYSNIELIEEDDGIAIGEIRQVH